MWKLDSSTKLHNSGNSGGTVCVAMLRVIWTIAIYTAIQHVVTHGGDIVIWAWVVRGQQKRVASYIFMWQSHLSPYTMNISLIGA